MEKKINRRRGALGAACALLVAASGLSAPVRAQWIVNDPVHTFQNILTQLKDMAAQAAEYQQQYARWTQTYSHYQQQLVRMSGIIKSFGLPAGRALEKVPEDYLVAERCGGGFSLTAGLRAILPARSGDYVTQQRDICAQIQMIQNTKYNETVQFIQQTVPAMQADMQRVQDMRGQGNENGTVDASAEASLQLMANLETQMQTWSARMQSYDSFIVTLKDAQRQIAQMALKGERNPIGTLVKTSALKAALEIDN